MKKLLLMRHAKSSFKEGDMPDFERPLSKRGEKDAVRMGKLLEDKDLTPDLILSSTAVRTARTAEVVAEKLDFKGEITYIQDFYLGEPSHYMAAVNDLDDEKSDTIMIIGHNPGLETLLQMLTDKVESLPTGAIAVLDVPIRSWKALNRDVIAHIKQIWRPREL